MKRVFTVSGVMALLTTVLFGQITVTNQTFPKVGDTLYTATDNLPANIDFGAPGGNQAWDFSGLQAPFTTTSVVRAASSGQAFAQFPDAELVMDFQVGEGYIDVTNNAFTLIGYNGLDPLGFGFQFASDVTPGQRLRSAPLQYNTSTQSSYALSITVSADSIPDSLLNLFPFQPDSLRVSISGDRTDEVDAWGSMQIPIGTFDVLREKRTELRDTRFEVKAGFFPWVDLTSYVAPIIPLFGAATVTSYHFYNDQSKEEIAVVNVDSLGQVNSVTYKAVADGTTVIKPISDKSLDIVAYPNPAIDQVRIDMRNLPSGRGTLKMMNILGVVVEEIPLTTSEPQTIKLDLQRYRKGTYLYAFFDQNDKNMITKRLIVIRP